MDSWDLFDTLIGRTCGSANNLFRLIANDIGDPDFPAKRVAAERVFQNKRQNYSLHDIYTSYADLNNLPEDAILPFEIREWTYELDNVFPIKKYIDIVKDGDIIVSDMYLNAEQLKLLMEKAGINKKVKIYVSCYGKHDGTIWKKIPEVKSILTHTGDSRYNDVDKPKNYGIRTALVNTSLSAEEIKYESWSPELAYWLRKERLSANIEFHGKDKLHYMQLEYNIPFLWASSHALFSYYSKKNLKKLLFMSRDCQIFMKVFQKLYPSVDCEYIYISRDCLQSNSNTYFKYLNKRLTHESALVDISASGGSLRIALPNLNIASPHLWTAFFLQEPFKVDLGFIQMERIAVNTETNCNNTHLEKLNYADHWHIIDVDKKEKPIYADENEYDMNIVKKYHEFIYKAIETIPLAAPGHIFGIVNYALQEINKEANFLKNVFPNHVKIEMARKQSIIAKNSNVVIASACWGYSWDRLSIWYKSIRKSGFTGDVHMVDLGLSVTTANLMTNAGIIVTKFEPTHRDNIVERFNSFATLASAMDPDTWIIFSDADDLVFQKNPIEYLKKVPSYYNIVVASEGVHFQDNNWTKNNLMRAFPDEYSNFADKFFYNAGSIAGKAKTITPLFKETVELCDTSPNGDKHDQAALNILLYSEKYKSQVQFTRHDTGWCFCGASSLFSSSENRRKFHGTLPMIISGVCKSRNGIIPVMFHHYVRNRTVKQQVVRRYSR